MTEKSTKEAKVEEKVVYPEKGEELYQDKDMKSIANLIEFVPSAFHNLQERIFSGLELVAKEIQKTNNLLGVIAEKMGRQVQKEISENNNQDKDLNYWKGKLKGILKKVDPTGKESKRLLREWSFISKDKPTKDGKDHFVTNVDDFTEKGLEWAKQTYFKAKRYYDKLPETVKEILEKR